MASPGWNPHKKGEHVFNDIAGSLENAVTSALTAERAQSLILEHQHGILKRQDAPLTFALLDSVGRDQILLRARTVVAPATGIHNDPNSRSYSDAKLKLERILSDLVISTADLIWKKKPRSNSSFKEFEHIVSGVRNASQLRSDANLAIDSLIDSAHDPQAEASALSERVSDTEFTARRATIDSMKQHRQALKLAGRTIVRTFTEEIERALERRIGPA